MALRVLTLNVGLLSWNLFGMPVFENPSFVEQRSRRLPEALDGDSFDVACFQECYSDAHFRRIARALAATHPHAARIGSGGLRFHNGLAIVSRFKIAHARLHRHRAATFAESVLATKAMLVAAVEVPGVGRVSIVNVHLSAGLNPTGDAAVAVRGRQAGELTRLCGALKDECEFVVAMGDFNAGPEADDRTYRGLVGSGFRDAWAWVHGPDVPGHTWDPSNPLNAGGVHGGCPGQRCDHVFLLAGRSARGFAFADCKIAAAEELRLDGGVSSTVSDHYGVAATIAATISAA
jgi:endonuclease/exonuclease/phosphatase family metal-dependent hydrolase